MHGEEAWLTKDRKNGAVVPLVHNIELNEFFDNCCRIKWCFINQSVL